jgi:glycosyltransferase involved in cell wall biosynthesis
VSTTVGCEGLDVVDGREVAVADGADALANACIRVLTDRDLRRHLTDVAYDRWEQDFRSEQVEDRIVQVVRRVIEDES